MSFLGKLFGRKEKESLDQGLQKTKEGFLSKLTKAIAGKSTVDAAVLDDLEEVLLLNRFHELTSLGTPQ